MLKRWFQNRLARTVEKEMRQFIGFLSGLNDEEMGSVLASTLGTAKFLESDESAHDILTALSTGGTGADMAAIALGDLIRELQRDDQLISAAGYMPWFHTLRAYNYPEVRGTAREMWDHLRRGTAHLDAELSPYEPDELVPYLEWAVG